MPPTLSKHDSCTSGDGEPRRKRPRGRVSWMEERESRRQSFPPGPLTAAELSNWPIAVTEGLGMNSEDASGEELKIRLWTTLMRGLRWRTDYTGVDCFREACEMALLGCEHQWGWEWPRPPFVWDRSCDKGKVQSDLLLQVARDLDDSYPCHFLDILHRLPDPAQEYLRAAQPFKKDKAADRIKAYEDIGRYVADNNSWLFPKGATSWCAVHQKMCPVVRSDVPPAWSSRGSGHHGAQGALRVSAAGVCCQGWSSEGQGTAKGHTAELPHTIWLQERHEFFTRNDEDVCFSECTPRYPGKAVLQQKLGDMATVVGVVTGPELQGWPCKRQRVLTAAINNSTTRWLGPPPEKVPQDFAKRFHRSVQLNGDVLFRASGAEVNQEYSSLANSRKFATSLAEITAMPKDEVLTRVLPPGGIQRMRDWHERMESLTGHAGLLVADLDHNTTAGSSAGLDWPVQLTHGSICLLKENITDWRLATGLECFGAMGFNMHPHDDCKFPRSKLFPYLKQLPPYQQKMLSGNGMHLLTQASFVMYVLANVAPVDYRMGMNLVSRGDSWEEQCTDDFAFAIEGDTQASAEDQEETGQQMDKGQNEQSEEEEQVKDEGDGQESEKEEGGGQETEEEVASDQEADIE